MSFCLSVNFMSFCLSIKFLYFCLFGLTLLWSNVWRVSSSKSHSFFPNSKWSLTHSLTHWPGVGIGIELPVQLKRALIKFWICWHYYARAVMNDHYPMEPSAQLYGLLDPPQSFVTSSHSSSSPSQKRGFCVCPDHFSCLHSIQL